MTERYRVAWPMRRLRPRHGSEIDKRRRCPGRAGLRVSGGRGGTGGSVCCLPSSQCSLAPESPYCESFVYRTMSVCVSGSDIGFTQRFDSGTAAEHRKSGHTRALKERIHIAFFSFLPFAFCLYAPEPTCWIRGATPRRILPMRVDRRMEGILVTHLRDYRLGLRHSSRAIPFLLFLAHVNGHASPSRDSDDVGLDKGIWVSTGGSPPTGAPHLASARMLPTCQ
ncbi:hypothetical protein BDP67DRAFT_82298 [Colletotrichum lupini]|nr:hypothetical protein BDP67DRAFT_82298 [Colletotrichum lupini]